MNIGDYVRTKDYQNIRSRIGKIIRQDEKYYYLDIDEDTQMVWEEDTVLKSSPDIIDLIEDGDYVNGKRVNLVYSPDGKQVFRLEFDVDGLKGHMLCESKHIKSIVTKEQFESMKYKVGD